MVCQRGVIVAIGDHRPAALEDGDDLAVEVIAPIGSKEIGQDVVAELVRVLQLEGLSNEQTDGAGSETDRGRLTE